MASWRMAAAIANGGTSAGAPIENRFGETALEVGAGITAPVNEAASLYAHADYRWSLDGDSRQTAVQGSIGVRVTWQNHGRRSARAWSEAR